MTTQAARPLRTALLTAVTMIFFATNSWLARLALREGDIDGGTFTAVRIFSGAAVLALLTSAYGGVTTLRAHGSWRAASALFGYAIAFSLAYLWLSAGVGAVILFAAVQITMIGAGINRGERPRLSEWIGLALALAGLVYLVSPGVTAPPLAGAALMAVSGVAWGYYSLAAKEVRSPTATTAGNFVRACPMAAAVLLVIWMSGGFLTTGRGLELAAISGGVTSGLGYALWYMALRGLSTTRAAIVQLTVPVIAAVGGVMFLGEQMSWRLLLAGAAILGGVGLAILGHGSPGSSAQQ